MSGFLAKLKLVTFGAANDLVDKAIDMNSPSALREYVREIEADLDKLHNQAAIQAGLVRTLTREAGDLQHKIDSESIAVQKIIAKADPTINVLARAKAQNILVLQKSLVDKQSALEEQKKASAAIDVAVTKLDSKHAQMVQQVRDLERIDRDTKIKESAAAITASAGRLLSDSGGLSVDDIKSKMSARHDVADEKFDRAMDTLQDGDSAEDSAAVDDLLAKLGQQPAGK